MAAQKPTGSRMNGLKASAHKKSSSITPASKRAKAAQANPQKTTAAKTGGKLVFGSPAWQAKYGRGKSKG